MPRFQNSTRTLFRQLLVYVTSRSPDAVERARGEEAAASQGRSGPANGRITIEQGEVHVQVRAAELMSKCSRSGVPHTRFGVEGRGVCSQDSRDGTRRLCVRETPVPRP